MYVKVIKPLSTTHTLTLEGEPPLLVRSFQVSFNWYAVHKNPVIPHADNKFYFQKLQFSSRNTTNVVKKNSNFRVLTSLAHILDISVSFIRINTDYWNRNNKNYRASTTKLIFTRKIVPVHATDCIFIFFM